MRAFRLRSAAMEAVFDLGDVELHSGVALPRARLACETHGTLNAARDNAIVYPTAYAGRHSYNAMFIGAGRAFDPSKYFIEVSDMLLIGNSRHLVDRTSCYRTCRRSVSRFPSY
jgi:homoserine acetyltransferase